MALTVEQILMLDNLVYYNKMAENEEDYQKIDEGQLNNLFSEKRLVVWQSYNGNYHYKYYPDND